MSVFTPLSFPVCGLEAKNRIALAPMTNCQSHSDGRLSPEEEHWLRLRIKGGTGIIITAGAYVDTKGQSWEGQIGIHNNETRDSFHSFTDTCKVNNCISIMQLFHGGMRAIHTPHNLSPSGATNSKGETTARSMGVGEIKQSIEHFIRAAERCHKAGFSGIEIHGAHGYLVHQFLSSTTNQRCDDWGGTTAKRERFLLEIIRGIRDRCGKDVLLGVRLSPEDANWFHGIDTDACLDLCERLSHEEHVDYIHVSLWDAFKSTDKHPEKGPAIGLFRNVINPSVPVLTAGKVWTLEDAERVLSMGADGVALGRVAIAHPNWVNNYMLDMHYMPNRPPFTKNELRKSGLSDVFIDYMRKWRGFVTNTAGK